MEKEKLEQLVGEALGELSAVFMSQEVKGTEIVMPTEPMAVIRDNLVKAILETN